MPKDFEEMLKQGANDEAELEQEDKAKEGAPAKGKQGAPADKTSDSAAVWTKQLESERKRNEQLTEMVRSLVAGSKNADESADEEEDYFAADDAEADEPDERPTKKRARALDSKRLQSGVQKMIERNAKGYLDPVEQRISQTQQAQLTLMARMQRRDFERELEQIGQSDLLTDIDKYIEDNSISPAQLAMDGAFRVIGQAVLGARQMEQFSKTPNLPSSGSRRGVFESDEPTFDPRAVAAFNDRYDGNLQSDEIGLLSKKEVTVNDYMKFLKDKSSRNRRATA